MNWDDRFLRLAEHIAGWSKDPSTQCGAVVTKGKRVISMGFNGFPQKVKDTSDRLNDRNLKYRMIIHAEVNAIMFAQQSLKGCNIFTWPMAPCSRCATQIIQSEIIRVVSIQPDNKLIERWGSDMIIADQMYKEAGVIISLKG